MSSLSGRELLLKVLYQQSGDTSISMLIMSKSSTPRLDWVEKTPDPC
jgi:hypothetical protein